jgi:hypothetical protein
MLALMALAGLMGEPALAGRLRVLRSTPAVPILRLPFAAYRVGSGSLMPRPAILSA